MAAKKIIAPPDDADDDDIPRDINEIRDELERRIRALMNAPSVAGIPMGPRKERAR